MGSLQLEDSIMVGGSYTGLLEMKLWGSNSNVHLMQSTIHGTKIEFTGSIENRCSHFLVVQAAVTSLQSTPSRSILQLAMTESTRVFPMPTQDVSSLCKVVEVCAGLGCLGHGMQHAGFRTVLRVDWSKAISELAYQLDEVHSCVANIAEDNALIPISELGSEAGTIAAGVSCQPYSRLGDKKQQHDARADTLPKTLRIAHLTRKQIIVLECVEGAMHCKWLQDILHQFAKETGYKIQQGMLHLQQVWPARRTRWWCLITHPSLGLIQWLPFPSFQPQPTLSCLTEKFLQISIEHIAKLELDTYELGKWGIPGLSRNTIDLTKQMATSLHSCANQLIPCPCGCRTHAMSEARLQKDGMHGLLVPLQSTVKAHDVIYPTMRHIHPDELSLFNGVQPGQNWGSNLKLALCALGQIASPLQSGWIASQIMSHLYSINLVQCKPPLPTQLLQNMMQKLLKARDCIFGQQSHQQATAFVDAISQMSNPVVNPPTLSTSDMEESNSAHESSQLKSTEDQTFPGPDERANHEHGQPDVQMKGMDRGTLDDLDHAILAATGPTTCAMKHETQDFAIGAVPGFAAKRKQMEESEQPNKRHCNENKGCDTTVPIESRATSTESTAGKGGGPCPRDRWCPNSGTVAYLVDGGIAELPSDETAVLQDGYETLPSSPEPTPAFGEAFEVYVSHREGVPTPVVTSWGTTVEQLLHAEDQLHSSAQDSLVTDAMGQVIEIESTLQPDQVVLLIDSQEIDRLSSDPPQLCHDKRDILLWRQKGWVAIDEMDFYVHTVGNTHQVHCQSPVQAPEDPSWEIAVCRHIVAMATDSSVHQTAVSISAILLQDHWIPLIVRNIEGVIQVQTTPYLSKHLQAWCQSECQLSIVFVAKPIEHVFFADCGFQAVKWFASALTDEHLTSMSSSQAAEWRGSFHRYLEMKKIAEEEVTKPLILGGMTKDEQSLEKLLIDHGVNPQRSQASVQHLMKTLGQPVVHQILSSPRPWADLKARSSMQQPPIRLVLADELQTMIQDRIKQGGPVGRKNNKQKTPVQAPQARFQLSADQVIIPPAVFVQSDGTELQQVFLKDLQPGCKGVVVANIEDALPFFGLTTPISQEGVGLIILDFNDARIPDFRTIIKVPVLCKQTNEPMLITAALVQLGNKEIKRNTPASCPVVQEVDNQVFRVLVFKDQYPHEWKQFVQAPVRHLMNQVPLMDISQQIVDVWDRQFLSDKMNKAQPEEAYLFAVSIRVHKNISDELAKTSGEEGKYVEPRIPTGRQPDPNFQVVWLPRQTFREATLAKQTSPVPCTLVRTADRYGLRTSHSQAEELHKIHRPDQMFLQGSEVRKFRVGPMPYGANKQSLANVFKTWKWNARPVGPFGQSRSRDGVLWIVQAVEDPQSWVYQLAHGDVLITPEDAAPTSIVEQPMPVLASSKTIQSLRQPNQKAVAKPEDPWLHHDPWQKSTSGSTKEASVHQITAVQARLEAIVEQKIRDHIPDTEMGNVQEDKSEARVVALEQQLHSLSANFQTFQQQQSSQHQMVQHQVQALDAKVEAQQTSIQQMLDHKLDDQMQRIEHLLSKRQRSQE